MTKKSIFGLKERACRGSHTMASESRPSVPDLLARETRRRPSVQLGRRLAYGELDGPWDEPGSGAFEELSSIPTPRHRDRGCLLYTSPSPRD